MHRFCKFESKVGSVSRARPSPDHTGNKLEVGQTFSVFPFRSILRLIYDQKRWRFSVFMWLVFTTIECRDQRSVFECVIRQCAQLRATMPVSGQKRLNIRVIYQQFSREQYIS